MPAHHIHSLSPTQWLPRAAAIEPNATAIHHVTLSGKHLRRSYHEFARRAAGLAYYLKRQGCKHVGLLAMNTPVFLESVYGIAGAAAVIVAINHRLKPDDIKYIFEHANVDHIIVDIECVPLLRAYQESNPTVPILVDTDTGDREGPFNHAIHAGMELDRISGDHGWRNLSTEVPNEDELIALSYTSGTTSRPKGVMYTHRGAYQAALGNIIEFRLNEGRVRCGYLWTLPMFHAMGWTFPWAVTAIRGTHYCLRKINYPQIWRLLQTEPISHFCAAPTVHTLLCHDTKAARLTRPVRVIVAGSPPSAVLLTRLTQLNFKPQHAYGLTETYGPVSMGYYLPEWDNLPGTQKYDKMARQGYAFVTSLALRVIKTDQGADLVDVAKNGLEIGEIILRGNMCAKGYYRDSQATETLFSGGWMHTGDLAVWHPDGAVQVLDRAKDIIISGGENISSVAVEGILAKYPDIVEVAVIGLPDETWGETPKAFVTLTSGSKTQGADIIKWALDSSDMGRFMVPRQIEIVQELPKTSTGKILKSVLKENEAKRRKQRANL